MDIEEKIIQGQKNIINKKLFPREIPQFDLLSLQKIVCFLGGRRTGKTSLMIQLAQQYIKKNIYRIDEIIFLDFSELDNQNIKLTDIYSLYQDKKVLYIFDEIQELQDFDKQLIWLYNQGASVFISGSNSHLLGKEISTKLRGRVYEIYNNVLNFSEFLVFKGKNKTIPIAEMDILFDEYLLRGGYPEVVLQDHPQAKKGLLQSYIDVIIYKDLIDRYHIRNEKILFHLVKSLIMMNTKTLNINKLFNRYKSLGYKISKNTLYEYMQYLQSNFFISQLDRYYKKGYFNKVYLIDNGYMNLFDEQEKFGQKFENCIYKYLSKQYSQLGYYDESYEIDFINEENKRQVCYLINENNIERETACAKTNNDIKLVTKENSSLLKKLCPQVKQVRYNELLLS